MRYNWQLPDWPRFRFDLNQCEGELLAFIDLAGQVSGSLKALPESCHTEVLLDLMIAEAIKTSEIEGEFLSRADVMSSIRNQLGINEQPVRVRSRASDGIGKLMVAVRNHWDQPLTANTLFDWHRMLLDGARGVKIGCWRTHQEPMQVISGGVGRPIVHFEAPPSARVPDEMAAFIDWFNSSADIIRHAPVRAAIAHLYFESIHPFEDGNGRIGRAIAEKALSQGLGRPALLSLSRSIETDKKAYYTALQSAQCSNKITPWIQYFAKLVLQAQRDVGAQIDFVLKKTRYVDRFKAVASERQWQVLWRMLEAGADGFEGGMNARKYMSLTKVSKATATRDLQALAESGALIAVGSGRAARYELPL